MTLMTSTHGSRRRSAWLRAIGHLFRWVRERQKQRHTRKRLAKLSDHLLRDAGLEHLIDRRSDRPFPHAPY